ncbi:MAG: LysR family transcriptional regulator [Alphaproteobacteria bacterium]
MQFLFAVAHMESWDDLRVVGAVARAGSLSGAARALGVHHATVFRRLGTIEQRLGVRLFERLASGYVPTPAGQEVAEAAARIEDDLAVLGRRVAGHDLRLTGTVRLATVDTLATLILPPHLAALREAHPGIVLEVVVAPTVANLSKREADVALRATVDPPETLVGRKLASIAHAIYALPSLADAADALAGPWVVPDDTLAGSMIARWTRRHVPPERVVARSNNLPTLAAMAAAGVGLTVLPCFVAAAHPGLVRVGGRLDGWDAALWLLTHEDLRRTARVRAVLDVLAEALAAETDRLAGRA